MNDLAALQAQRHEALFAELFAEPGTPEREHLERRSRRLGWLVQDVRARMTGESVSPCEDEAGA
ncbi:hypothetical protein GCM10022631_30130 [Deinococcus rubellus]|uniref:hypothetical protein n=1 Tax=Deinococcus rubellus TaxID=1889240 RepID=UPI0031EDC82B